MERFILGLAIGCAAFTADAQVAQKPPERHAGYAHLENFVGKWTVRGSEASFTESCDWYHGNYHVVCHSETKRADGSAGHGMSILGFVPGKGYVYSGIGSRGRYATHHSGTFRDGIFEFLDNTTKDGKPVVARTRLGPFTPAGFTFAVDTSADGGSWTAPQTITYLRLK